MLLALVPDWCRNLSSPACCVMLAKTTGAPSTNPPAVIGRCSASKTAYRGAPVLTPMPLEAGCDFAGPASWAHIEGGGPATNPNIQRKNRRGSTLFLRVMYGSIWWPDDELRRDIRTI